MSFRAACGTLLLTAGLGLVPVGPLAAQVPLTPRALGMGGAFVASARGFESVFHNPANLGLADTPAWSIAFPQLSVGADVLGPEVGDLPDFIDFDNLSDAERNALLAKIPESGSAVGLDVRAPLVALQVGNFGLGVALGMTAEHTVGKDLIELLFEGYEEGRFDYRVGDTRGERATFWDLSAGYGRTVGPVSLGVAGHYYLGRSLVQTRAFEPRFDFFGRRIEVDYVGVSSPGGTGYGVDVGAALQPFPGLTVSAAVANLVSSMDWDEGLLGRTITLTNEDFQDAELALLEDRYERSEREIGENPSGQFGQVAVGLFDGRDLPATLRLGAAWKPAPLAEVGVAYEERLGDGRLLGRWDRRLGGGAQVKIPFVSLRVGGSSNLDGGGLLGAGITLGVVDLGIARYRTAGGLDDAERDGVIGSFSVNVSAR